MIALDFGLSFNPRLPIRNAVECCRSVILCWLSQPTSLHSTDTCTPLGSESGIGGGAAVEEGASSAVVDGGGGGVDVATINIAAGVGGVLTTTAADGVGVGRGDRSSGCIISSHIAETIIRIIIHNLSSKSYHINVIQGVRWTNIKLNCLPM